MKNELEKAIEEFNDFNGDNLEATYRADWRALNVYNRHTLEREFEVNDTVVISVGGHFTLTRKTMQLLMVIMDNL